jgi:hypothetical protein
MKIWKSWRNWGLAYLDMFITENGEEQMFPLEKERLVSFLSFKDLSSVYLPFYDLL